MRRMRAPRAPNERFARGKGASETCARAQEAADIADPLEPASRTRSSFSIGFACPTREYQTPRERAQKKEAIAIETRTD